MNEKPDATSGSEPRQPGALKGRISMTDDFDEVPEEIAAAFKPEDDEPGESDASS